MIAIIDYGLGNLKSISNAFLKLGIPARVTSNKKVIERARGIVLPGVGAFAQGMKNLNDFGLISTIRKVVRGDRPFLGICLGLQLLFTLSEEHGLHKGLDIVKGRVKRFTTEVKIPHMGWNQVHQLPPPKADPPRAEVTNHQLPIFQGIPNDSYFYFVHSYYAEPKDKSIVIGTTEYGLRFASAVNKSNIWGLQFHPEKSADVGLKMLENFVKLC